MDGWTPTQLVGLVTAVGSLSAVVTAILAHFINRVRVQHEGRKIGAEADAMLASVELEKDKHATATLTDVVALIKEERDRSETLRQQEREAMQKEIDALRAQQLELQEKIAELTVRNAKLVQAEIVLKRRIDILMRKLNEHDIDVTGGDV